jgi:hypothetical protein
LAAKHSILGGGLGMIDFGMDSHDEYSMYNTMVTIGWKANLTLRHEPISTRIERITVVLNVIF